MRSARREKGATVVESAFVLPIFFLLLLGLIDFGLLALESNKASNAARDGARVGIIDYQQADVVGSGDYNAIKAAIEKNLPGRTIPDADLVVECLTPAGSTVTCANAVLDEDRLSVSVEWQRDSISPITAALGFGSVGVTGESRMTIVGRPVSGPVTPPPPCNIASVSVAPGSVERNASGELTSDLTVTVTGTGSCSSQTVNLVDAGGAETQICASGCLGDTTYVGNSDNFWTAGTASAEVRTSAGTVLVSDTFTVNDVPPPCSLTSFSVSPGSVNRTTSGNLGQNLTLNVTGSGTCDDLTIDIQTPNAGPIASVCSPATCNLGNNGYLANTDNFWTTSGPATARLFQGATQVSSVVFTVTDPPPGCTVDVDVDPNPATAKQNDKELDPIDITITATGGDCSNLTVRVLASNAAQTPFAVCSGSCLSTFTFDGKTSSNGVWVAGTANVEVTDNITGTTVLQPFTVNS